MDLITIKLASDDYEKFVSGGEVTTRTAARVPREGEEVLVLRDTTANHTVAGTPTREGQADYIGIKGIVIGVSPESVVSIVKR